MSYLKFVWKYIKINISTAMEYRFNFFIQSIFMIVNNTAFTLFWYFLFRNMETLNGWSFNEVVGLFGFAALAFGINSFFFGNWRNIGNMILNGELDFYLGLPKDELTHMLISKSSFSAFGDIIFGIGIFVLFFPITINSVLLFIFTAITGSIVWANIMVLANSATFWIGNSTGLSSTVSNMTMALTTYPSALFDGVFKFIFMFIIPIFFINNVQLELFRNFSWTWVLTSIIITILLTLITRWVFKRGLRKYESGNLISVRV